MADYVESDSIGLDEPNGGSKKQFLCLQELGAAVLIPLLTQRSPRASEGRTDRWERVGLAAAKQCEQIAHSHCFCRITHQALAKRIVAEILCWVACDVR